MSTPAVISGCSLLPSMWADPPFHIGPKSPSTFADPKGTAQGVGLLISSSENTYSTHLGE
jgi:hypothetical protein